MKGWTSLLSVVVLCTLAVVLYRGILFPSAGARYPWGSDTMGHLMKGLYLWEELKDGHRYPDLFPGWYNGLQMFRYHPPLPYYVLLTVALPAGADWLTASSTYIVLCALIGALGWLLYRRWLGWGGALVGGALFLLLPDNVRVAMAEGNLPRVLATALLPYLLYALLRLLEGGGWGFALGVAAGFAAVVLCHAMMAAIYALGGGLVALGWWVTRRAPWRRVMIAGVSIGIGLGLSGWWLLPSLQGGITELDPEAMTEALAVLPLWRYGAPLIRLHDPEAVYVSGVLLILTAVGLWGKQVERGAIALAVVGWGMVLASTPGFNTLFNALPLHNLFWPLRFLGFAGLVLLFAWLWRARELWDKGGWQRWLVVLTSVALGLDFGVSLHLIHLRPPQSALVEAAESLRKVKGWREATLDFSHLGSEPSYRFTAEGGREQVYGWAYQGARTAANVAALNEALRRGFGTYLVDRLTLLGADDLVVLEEPPLHSSIPEALEQAGFQRKPLGNKVVWYHRDGAPRAYRVHWKVLGIGRGVQNAAYFFPQMIVGTDREVDAYTEEELSRFDVLFLSGFRWHDRKSAEELVRTFAEAGHTVIVDLTGVPEDPMAKEPYFLGVWGEPIALRPEALTLVGMGRSWELRPFATGGGLWQTYTPQGLDEETLIFDYLGERGVAMGYKRIGQGKVWFVGLNLPYHAVETLDPVALEILAKLLELPVGEKMAYQEVPLEEYHADSEGYHFAYTLDEPDQLLLPVAHHGRMAVVIDGEEQEASSLERLVVFRAPAGRHTVWVYPKETPIYALGRVTTGISLIALTFLCLFWRRWCGGGKE